MCEFISSHEDPHEPGNKWHVTQTWVIQHGSQRGHTSQGTWMIYYIKALWRTFAAVIWFIIGSVNISNNISVEYELVL